MSSSTGKAWDGKILRRVFSYTKPYRSMVFGGLVIISLVAFLEPFRATLMGNLVEDFISKGDKEGLVFWGIVIIVLLLAETVFRYLETLVLNILGQNVIRDLRSSLFSHLLQLRLKYFDNNPIGMLVTRSVSDMETITQIFTQGLFSIFGDILKLTVALAAMLILNWKLTLLVLIPIPFLLIATAIFKRAIKKSFTEVRVQVSALNTFVQERITGMSLVKIFGREKQEAERFSEINNKHKKAHIKSIWAYSIFFPVVEILSATSQGMVVLYIVYASQQPDVVASELAGDITRFILFIGMFFRPIRQLADRFNTLQMGMVGAERVFKVLDTKETIEQIGDSKEVNFREKIEFKNVTFAYNEGSDILKDVSFTVNPEETVAFVGATGAGKSTIINIICRFYEFQKGEVLIGGTVIRDINLSHLRTHLALVLQDVYLFSDSIYNNITLGDKSISKEDVIEAAKLVGAHDFISKLPGGYDFDVKERGSLLSVGQRQLISFIRAYVFNPEILILDEATSSIDSESEILIQNAIEKLTKGRTSIVIAHRLSTIKNADRIMVLDQGQIIESGSHSELLNLESGKYKDLYEQQFDQ